MTDSVGTKVLELSPGSSRTPRPMEYVWALLTIVLFVAHLESGDASRVIAEKVTFASCKKDRELAEKYAGHFATLLTHGGIIEVPGATKVSCKTTQVGKS